MREPVEKTIDGENYTFCQMPPKRSLKLLTRLVRIVGPTIGAAFDGIKPGEFEIEHLLDLDMDISRIVTVLCSRLDENDVETIVDDLLSQVIHAGQGEVSKKFDMLFAGRLPHLFKVVGTALRVEYGDFLAEGPDIPALLRKAGMIQAQRT